MKEMLATLDIETRRSRFFKEGNYVNPQTCYDPHSFSERTFFQSIPSRTSTSNHAAVSFEESLPEVPPGATVVFSDAGPTSKKAPINGVFLKRIEANADQTVWTVSSGEVPLGTAENSAPSKSAIAFVVPQLPRG